MGPIGKEIPRTSKGPEKPFIAPLPHFSAIPCNWAKGSVDNCCLFIHVLALHVLIISHYVAMFALAFRICIFILLPAKRGKCTLAAPRGVESVYPFLWPLVSGSIGVRSCWLVGCGLGIQKIWLKPALCHRSQCVNKPTIFACAAKRCSFI